MVETDRRGLPISTGSEVAAAAYRDGVDLMMSAWPGAGEALDRAVAADPGFMLAHAAWARLHAMRGEPGPARECIARARALGGTERELSHLEVIGRALEGPVERALAAALEHIERWPLDALIVVMPLGAFGLFAFSGMAEHDQARVNLCDRHAAAYPADDWWMLTYRGWAHVENGDHRFGRALVERAFELRPRNGNAVHALSHAMFEAGSGGEAAALIDGWLPGYDRGAALHGHIAWHRALVALEAGDADAALALYRAEVRPSVNGAFPLNVVTDSASLLWRLQAYGHAAPLALWDEVAGYAERAFPRAGPGFVDVHMAMIAAARGDRAGLERRVGALPVGHVAAVCRGMLAFAEGDHAGCVRLLEPVAAEVVRIGGSHAQRELVEDTLLLALLRGGEVERGRALLDRRLHRRPSPRDARWRAMA